MKNLLLLPLSTLPRVGDSISKYLKKLVSGERIFDLLLHKPLRAEKIMFCPRLFEVRAEEMVVLKLKITAHIKPENSRQPFKVQGQTADGVVNLIFFKVFPGQLEKLKVNSEIAVLGYLQKNFVGRQMEFQISHPQQILPALEIHKMPKINVVYPLTAGITQRFLTQKIHEVLKKIEQTCEEWIDKNLVKSENWPSFSDALKILHYYIAGNYETARKRLGYDELLAWQLAIILTKNTNRNSKNFSGLNKNLSEIFLQNLPFEPTKSQLQAISEIEKEICSNKKMLRLLQGDVGSGKTVVAIAACLLNASQSKQSCVIVPIAVLAKQHFKYFQQLLKNLDVTVELLVGSSTKKHREKVLQDLAEGKIDILISTHAVLEDNVKFHNLGLAIIDEQHRFGVMQRLKLVEKGQDVDVLLMSATPIPRSLMMGLYGDMDISILKEKPKNRQKIETLIMSENKIDEVYQAMKRAVLQGEKIYWICPAIEEMDEETLKNLQSFHSKKLVSAKEKFKELSGIFGEAMVGLIHGKMKETEKEKSMLEFTNGDKKILVATTVIEVGIDVSDATIILIENAEHFGLSQLHQLRGRVGRSDKKSFCILIYGEKLGANSRQRLNILRESNDGFFIAEEDLKMRGSGDLLGTRQSGFPEFKIADLGIDADLLKIAHKNAEVILLNDEKLESPESYKFHDLLKLFDYDDCLNIVSGG